MQRAPSCLLKAKSDLCYLRSSYFYSGAGH
jgi:hypothetical protein